MTYKIREFTMAFVYLDDGSMSFMDAITGFASSIKYPARIKPRFLTITYDRNEPDTQTPEEIEAARLYEEEQWKGEWDIDE